MTAIVLAVVVNWNGGDHLARCVATLAAQVPPIDVLVVDNASTDGSLATLPDDVPVLRNTVNRGYAGAANDGVRWSQHPYVLVCNPDVRFAPDHVTRLVARMDADDSLGSMQGLLLRLRGEAQPPPASAFVDSAGHGIRRSRLFANLGEGESGSAWLEPAEVFGVTGAAALHRRAMLDDVGTAAGMPAVPFDESLFAFFEDVDLDWRARLRGWRAACEPAALAWHERGGRGPRRTARVEELNFANRLLVLARHDVAPDLVSAVMMLAATLAKLLRLPAGTRCASLRRVRAGWWPARHVRRRVRATATVHPRDVVRDWVGRPPRRVSGAG